MPVPLTEGRTLRSAAAFARRAVEPVAREDVVPAREVERVVFASDAEEALEELAAPSGTTLVRGRPGPLAGVAEDAVLPLAAREADVDAALVDAALEEAVFFTDFSSLFEF